MKAICLLASVCLMFAPVSVEEIACEDGRVSRACAVRYMNEWYVALVTEPIYLRSENQILCSTLAQKIQESTGYKANVIIDLGVYLELEKAKDSQEKDRVERMQKIQKIFESRCQSEYYRYYQT